jgi:hypothetical protein
MDGSESPGPGAERSLGIAAVVVAIVVVAQLLSAGGVAPEHRRAEDRPVQAGVVWVEQTSSLVAHQTRPRQEVTARSATDAPDAGWLLIGSIALPAAASFRALHRASRRVASPPRRTPAGDASPVLRPG